MSDAQFHMFSYSFEMLTCAISDLVSTTTTTHFCYLPVKYKEKKQNILCFITFLQYTTVNKWQWKFEEDLWYYPE